jgi:hypothetical protein
MLSWLIDGWMPNISYYTIINCKQFECVCMYVALNELRHRITHNNNNIKMNNQQCYIMMYVDENEIVSSLYTTLYATYATLPACSCCCCCCCCLSSEVYTIALTSAISSSRRRRRRRCGRPNHIARLHM